MFTAKFELSRYDEKCLIDNNLTRLVYTTGKFEGLSTTLAQTNAIIHRFEVRDVSTEDRATVLNLKCGYQFLMDNQASDVTIVDILKINQIVKGGQANSGKLRTVEVQVPLTNAIWVPPIPTERTIQRVQKILNADKSAIDRALDLNLVLSRWQLFEDGNKRTALIAANLVLVQAGAGILMIPEGKMHWYGSQLAKFYRTNNMVGLKQWLYDNCLFGM